MPKLNIRRNDTVYVRAGKDKGKTGRVIHVDPDKGQVIVEKLNQLYEHVRPNPQKQIKGGIVQKEGAMPVSKVQLVCPACNKPTRVGRTRLGDGKSARVCKKCNTTIES